MRLHMVIATALAISSARASSVCDGLYGNHSLFHRLELNDGSYSKPLQIDLSFRTDGTLVSSYYFEDHVESVIFSKNFPQHMSFNLSGHAVLECSISAPKNCTEIKFRAHGYNQTLQSRLYVDYLDGQKMSEVPSLQLRERILSCASYLLSEVAGSADISDQS